MKIDMIEFIDEIAYAIENSDELNYGIFPFKTDNEVEEELQIESYCILETIGWNEDLLKRNANVEKKLRKNKKTITGSIGKDSYKNILDIFGHFNSILEFEIYKLRYSYDSIKEQQIKQITI